MLDNRHRSFEGEHNELLRRVTSLEKGLVVAEKKRDEAVEALEESQKREEDLHSCTAEREKVFVEQLFSVTKALSDAAGVDFDAQALNRPDALASVVATVEDHSVSAKDSLRRAKGVLGRLREEMVPKAELIENLDDLVESFAEGVPMDFKNSQQEVGATMGLAMAQAHDVELDPNEISLVMPVNADGQQVVFAPFATSCCKYGPRLIETIAAYSVELRWLKDAKAMAFGAIAGKSVASETATDSRRPSKSKATP